MDIQDVKMGGSTRVAGKGFEWHPPGIHRHRQPEVAELIGRLIGRFLGVLVSSLEPGVGGQQPTCRQGPGGGAPWVAGGDERATVLILSHDYIFLLSFVFGCYLAADLWVRNATMRHGTGFGAARRHQPPHHLIHACGRRTPLQALGLA